MIFFNETIYKTLKKVFMYVFPSIMFVWDNLYKVWNIPYGVQISSTIFALWIGFGIFLGICKYKYQNATEGYLSDGRGVEDDLFSVDESSTDNEEL